MRIGSLDNYRLILNYSLTIPGRSNIQTIGLANKEFNLTPASKGMTTNTSTQGEQREFKWEEYFKNSDDSIRKMEAKVLNMTGAYVDLFAYETNLTDQETKLTGIIIDLFA